MNQTNRTAVRLNAAVKYHQAGDLDKAERIYKKILSKSPDQVDALHLIGVVAYQSNRLERAAKYIEKAISINPEVADFHLNLGNIFQATGQFERALAEFERALELHPQHAMAMNNMANTMMALDRYLDAAALMEQAVAAHPSMAVVYHTLGMAYRELEKYDLSLEQFETALRLNPGLLETWINIGDVYHKLDRIEEAMESFDRAMAMDPKRFETRYNLANVLQESGEFERAIENYEIALTLNPRHTKSIGGMIQARKYDSADHPDRERLLVMLDEPELPVSDQANLHFAMAKMLNDCGEYDDAFSHYKLGNSLTEVKFNINLHDQFVTGLTTTYHREYFKRQAGSGANSHRPVFIVGMPRSGTTLVEQILSSHPRINGAGELPDIQWMIRRLSAELKSSWPYPRCMNDLDYNLTQRLAGQYLKRLSLVSSTADRITDKLPANFLHLGFIAALFPNATVIHCRRHPIDTCLSCYFQNFTQGQNFSFDLDNLGFYYRSYERLMAHWAKVLPVAIHEVTYEDLIENPEEVSRGLVSACRVEWDHTCLSPQNNSRPVKTASSWQVRQPMYKTSVARWKHYEKYLDPLKASLGLLEKTPV